MGDIKQNGTIGFDFGNDRARAEFLDKMERAYLERMSEEHIRKPLDVSGKAWNTGDRCVVAGHRGRVCAFDGEGSIIVDITREDDVYAEEDGPVLIKVPEKDVYRGISLEPSFVEPGELCGIPVPASRGVATVEADFADGTSRRVFVESGDAFVGGRSDEDTVSEERSKGDFDNPHPFFTREYESLEPGTYAWDVETDEFVFVSSLGFDDRYVVCLYPDGVIREVMAWRLTTLLPRTRRVPEHTYADLAFREGDVAYLKETGHRVVIAEDYGKDATTITVKRYPSLTWTVDVDDLSTEPPALQELVYDETYPLLQLNKKRYKLLHHEAYDAVTGEKVIIGNLLNEERSKYCMYSYLNDAEGSLSYVVWREVMANRLVDDAEDVDRSGKGAGAEASGAKRYDETLFRQGDVVYDGEGRGRWIVLDMAGDTVYCCFYDAPGTPEWRSFKAHELSCTSPELPDRNRAVAAEMRAKHETMLAYDKLRDDGYVENENLQVGDRAWNKQDGQECIVTGFNPNGELVFVDLVGREDFGEAAFSRCLLTKTRPECADAEARKPWEPDSLAKIEEDRELTICDYTCKYGASYEDHLLDRALALLRGTESE